MERGVSPSKIICENNVKKLLTNVGTGGIIAKSLMTSRRIRLLNGEKHCWFRKKILKKVKKLLDKDKATWYSIKAVANDSTEH